MNNDIKNLIEAIDQLKTISFEYNKEGKTRGVRIGHPYAVFIMDKKDGTSPTMAHIVQTGGVSDSGQEFPSFRQFTIDDLSDVKISEDNFIPNSPLYNPEWEKYSNLIAKV